jgi:hypothetical protein
MSDVKSAPLAALEEFNDDDDDNVNCKSAEQERRHSLAAQTLL